ncbi:MAG TPA: STAS domain-containing protein [Aridibacter sp.]|nr:STAS domain-containing protein [Aridibacter sp.]
MSHLFIRERRDSDLTILDLSRGSVDGFRKIIFGLALQRLIDMGQNQVVLNLAKVPYVDAAGLGELISARLRVSESGGQMKMCELSDRNLELIALSGLISVFEIFENETLATSSFQIRRHRRTIDRPSGYRGSSGRNSLRIF